MDLSVIHTNQQEMGMQNILNNDYENQVQKIKETFQETDVTGNNNSLNPIKTETDDVAFKPGSLFQGFKNNFCENKNSCFNHLTIKKAMDLTVHSRTNEGKKRTIFDDADYFAKNYMYKLLPITFESVDETIIHTEHNYCNLTNMSSESENDEDCSRTMDYSWIKEKNYKRRKVKCSQSINENDIINEEIKSNGYMNSSEFQINQSFALAANNSVNFQPAETNCSMPLDLSAPLVQEEKTVHCLKEQPNLVANNTVLEEKEDSGGFDSDKENLKSKSGCIEVTITRPDEKKNYQPCDLFLNDIARLVPKLIGKDCSEVDILDRTCEHDFDIQKHRLYYIISESTWRLFQSTNERVILTNDQSLVRPVEKKERDERPTYLVFDQYSLAKCLADYCKETGGCFEYICVEEGKEEGEEMEGGKETVENKMNEIENDDREKEKEKLVGKNTKNQKPVDRMVEQVAVEKVQKLINETEGQITVEKQMQPNTKQTELKLVSKVSIKEEKKLITDESKECKQSNSSSEEKTLEKVNEVKNLKPEEEKKTKEGPKRTSVETRNTKNTDVKTAVKPKPKTPIKKEIRLTKKVSVEIGKNKTITKFLKEMKTSVKKGRTSKPVRTSTYRRKENEGQKKRSETSGSSQTQPKTKVSDTKSKVASTVKTRSKSATSQKSDKVMVNLSRKRKKESESEEIVRKRRRVGVSGGDSKGLSKHKKSTERAKNVKANSVTVKKREKETKEKAEVATKKRRQTEKEAKKKKTKEEKGRKQSNQKGGKKGLRVTKTLTKGKKR